MALVLRQEVSRIQKEAMILSAGLAYPNPTAGVVSPLHMPLLCKMLIGQILQGYHKP